MGKSLGALEDNSVMGNLVNLTIAGAETQKTAAKLTKDQIFACWTDLGDSLSQRSTHVIKGRKRAKMRESTAAERGRIKNRSSDHRSIMRCSRWCSPVTMTTTSKTPVPWSLGKLDQFRFRSQKLTYVLAARPAILTQSLDIQLLQFHCGALGSFVAIVSDRAVHSHVCVARIQEVVSQRLAGRNALVRREPQHAEQEI